MSTPETKKSAEAPSPALAGEGWGEGRPGWVLRRQGKTERAKGLRKNQTEAEKRIWHHLRAKQSGHKFKRQFPVGPYFADFACVELKLIVELDGGQHCENKKDEVRTRYLNERGYEVVRFWNNDIMDNPAGVLSTLSLTLSRKCGRGDNSAVNLP